ncbi:MAG: hypothetical protein HQL55_17710, partial [Magnetococcales bacterium]|nr:hypothetical protein [Magnetococcales bacterium]
DITGIYLPNGAPVAGSSNDNYNGSRNAYVSLTTTTTTGTYYVAVAGHGRTTGTYTLLVNSADGVTADTSTNATLTLGSVQSGWINQPGDVDWLRVVLEGGVTYMTSMDSPRVTYGALYDPKIIGVYSSSGGYFANTGNDNYGTSRNSRASFTPASSGTYYVAVSANGNGVGSYTLTTQFIGATLATNLNVNVAVSGNISVREEVDWFRIQLQGGATYTLAQRGRSSSGGTLFDPQMLGVYTQSGNLVSGTANDNTNASRDATVSFSVVSSGTYYVGARGHGVYTGSYTLALTMTDQAPASVATTAVVTQSTNVSGDVHFANDVDWIKMVLTEDTPYAISQWGSASNQGTLVNPYIQGVYDSSGSLLANTSNDNYGSNKDARVFFTPVSSGTYYAAMRGMGTGTGSYTVGLDLALELSPTSLALNTPLSRSVASSGEVDWYALSLIGGMAYSFQQSGRYTNKGTLVNPKIVGLYTPSGALIAQTTNDNINSTNPNAEVEYTPAASGTYYLAVGAGDAGIGTYTISMQTNDLPAAIITEGYITVNDKMVSSIEVSGDVDWIALVMYQDMRYDISLNGLPTNQGTLRDPVIIGLQNYLGAAILNSGNDNNGSSLNALVSYTPTVSSLYYIAVGGKNTYTGTYTLEVRSPDTAGDVTTTRTLAVGGTLYSYIDQAGDRDWFAITLTEGLYYTVAMQTISLSDPYLAGVYSDAGQLLANTTNDNVSSSDLNAQVVFVAPSSGTYYIGAGSSNSTTGSYSLALQTVAVAASGRQRTPAIHRESEFVFQPVGMQEVVDGSLMAETTSLAVAPSLLSDLSLPILAATPPWAVLTAG